MTKNLIITFTGPSCSGKSTLTRMLTETGKFTEIVSTTTRPPRDYEVDGVHYNFVSPEEFSKIDMLETVQYNNNFYGASVKEFDEKFNSGLTPVIVVEPYGMEQINENSTLWGWSVFNVFVDCPTKLQYERLITRMFSDYENQDKNAEALVKEYSGRLDAITRVERKWGETFLNQMFVNNHLIIKLFDETTQDEILDKLISMVYYSK